MLFLHCSQNSFVTEPSRPMEGFLQRETPLVVLFDSAVEQILVQTSIGREKDHQKTFGAADQLCVNISYLKEDEKNEANAALQKTLCILSFFFCICEALNEWRSRNKRGSLDGGSFAAIPSTLSNLSAWTLKKPHSVTFVYKPLERACWPAHIPLLGFKRQEAFFVSGSVH